MREYFMSLRDASDISTPYSVIKNIAHLCGRNKSKMWGPDGWKKVVVCVVSDGRNKINKRTLQVLTLVSKAVFCGVSRYLIYLPRWVATKMV